MEKSAMTQKHFVFIAASLKQSLLAAITECERKTVKAVCFTMAANLSDTNPKFDSVRFLKACGLK
jgi:hypothetical protein